MNLIYIVYLKQSNFSLTSEGVELSRVKLVELSRVKLCRVDLVKLSLAMPSQVESS